MYLNKNHRISLLILTLLTAILYLNTLNHAYVLDDFSVIKENRIVKQGVEGIPTIWKTHYRYGYGYQQANSFRPLTLTFFAIQWEISPDNPHLAHWFNVLIYILLVWLIFLFLTRLLHDDQQLIVFISCLLFVAHPIHTEVVANIKSLDELLASTFSFAGILLLLRYLENKQIRSLVFSLLLFLAAFFSKESTIAIVACIPFILVLFRKANSNKAIKITSLYLIPFGIYLAMRHSVLGSLSGNQTISKLDNLLVAAPNELVHLATAVKILGLYLWKLIFPHPLINDYSFQQIQLSQLIDSYVWISLFVYLALVILFFKLRKKNSILAFAIAFYLINLALYSNLFITIGTSFGERLLFLPSLGFCLAIAYFLSKMNRKVQLFQIRKFKPALPLLLTATLILIYSYKTIDRNKAWEDNFTLYSTDIENCDKSARCHYYLGLGYVQEKALKTTIQTEKQNYLQQAVQSFNRAIKIYPEYSDAWGQKGLAYYRLNAYKEAETAYLKSVEYDPSNATSFSNLGSLYFGAKNYKAAKESFEKALKVNPNHLDANANYAATLGTLGELEKAVIHFKKAISIDPNQANYYQMLGATYQNMGKQKEAEIYLRKASELNSKNNQPN